MNVSMTSSKDPDRVKEELINIFQEQNMQYDCSGYVVLRVLMRLLKEKKVIYGLRGFHKLLE